MIAKVLTALLTIVIAAADHPPHTNAEKNYGQATVEKINDVQKGFVFRCDIKDWPPIVGTDITIKIANIEAPTIVAQGQRPNDFYQVQAQKFLKAALEKASTENKKIVLKNIRRGKSFNLIAEIDIDGTSLAETMIKTGLARRPIPGQAQTKKDKTKKTKTPTKSENTQQQGYIASKSSKIFHRATCSSAKRITQQNRIEFQTTQKAQQTGRRPCKRCTP